MLHSSRRFWDSVPPASLRMFLGAVFALFSTVALTRDISSLGQLPGPHLAILTLVSGLFAVSWAMVFIRGARWLLVSVVVLGLLIAVTRVMAVPVPTSSLDADAVASIRDRLRLDSALVIAAVMAGYVFFVTFLAGEGARYLKAHTEIALAREIHQLLVPPIARRVGPFEFYGASLPSGEVGGDLIDLVETRDAWVATLADVSGHGVASGTLMGMFKSGVRSRLRADTRLDALLTDINQVVFDLKKSNMFVTCALLRGTSGGQLEFTLAGHLPILHYRRAAGRVDELSLMQLAIGMFRDQTFMAASATAESGDVFALVSDGLTEVFNARDEELGLAAIEDLLALHGREPLADLFARIVAAAQSHGRQLDDQSLLLVRYG